MNGTSLSRYSSSYADVGVTTPVSVIMPVRDEERYLEEAVRHVLAQDHPGGLEVVLAVGPSRDATMQIAERLAAADHRVTVVANPSGLIPAANNAAIKASRFPVVARVDGHALIPPGYLAQAVRTLAETGADDVGGIMAACGVTPFEQAVAWAMTSPAGVGSSRFHTGGKPGQVDTVYLGVYRRRALDQVGGYDEAYLRAEDWEMNHRIRQAGGLIWFEPRLKVTYRPRSSVRALAIQYFNYGRWRRVVSREHAGTVSLRYLAPPAAVAAMTTGLVAGLAGLAALAGGPGLGSVPWLGGVPGASGVPWPAWLTLGFAVPAAYLAGILAVTGLAARDLRPQVLVRLPAALVTMHLCWGAGFLTSPRRLTRRRSLAGPAVAQEGLGDGQVGGVGDLDVALAARHDVHAHLGQVAQHDPAVVGRGQVTEAGVGGGELVRLPDHRQPEPLRRLAPHQAVPARYAGDDPVADHGDRVGRGHRHPHGAVPGQRRHAAGDRRLVHQGPGRVVEQHVTLGAAELGDGPPGGLHPGAPTSDDLG
jgi:succinoglycan biosynthesis protein ExoA